jgi:glutathione S-transferase
VYPEMSNFIGQLPILHYDDFSITQTHAVMRFIAKKYGYVGETSEEEARAEEVAELIYDLRLCNKSPLAFIYTIHFNTNK